MHLDTALALLADNPATPLDIAEVALLIARDEYPHLDLEGELSELTGLAHELRDRLHGSFPARIDLLCRYLFHDLGFHGNQRNYHDPRNSYLNEVLTRRTGLPITLSILTMAVGTRAGLNIAGVGLPGHFIVRADEDGQHIYLDPFHGGRLLTIEECEALVQRVLGTPYQATPEALAPVAVGPIVQRLLANLKNVYFRQGDHLRAARIIGRLIQLCPTDLTQQRDLGVALVQAGRPGLAIDPLKTYLASTPPPMDAQSIREVLQQAEAAVARWN